MKVVGRETLNLEIVDFVRSGSFSTTGSGAGVGGGIASGVFNFFIICCSSTRITEGPVAGGGIWARE